MSSIKIVADSTCDLSSELIRDYGITILPLNIVLDMTSYSDGEEISPDEIYVWHRPINGRRKQRLSHLTGRLRL